MRVAKLGARFRNLRNLRLGATTLYWLADHVDEQDLPAVINELAKHAEAKRLPPREAERVIQIGIGRRRFGNEFPDATLAQLARLDDSRDWHKKTIAELRKHRPNDDEAARQIVDEVMDQYFKAKEAKDAAEWQAFLRKRGPEIVPSDPILDGDPPVLPPPITPPEPQKLGGGEQEIFKIAVKQLRGLQTKPLATFAGLCSPTELREVIDFLRDVNQPGTPVSRASGATWGVAQFDEHSATICNEVKNVEQSNHPSRRT
jgi:hypothetical protein